jgi:hypothetical protein
MACRPRPTDAWTAIWSAGVRSFCREWAAGRPNQVIAVVIVWALVRRVSPGLALIAGALTFLLLDWLDPTLLDRLLGYGAV